MKVQIYSIAILALLSVAYALKECPEKDDEFAVTIVNPEDCGSFYLCDNGEPILTFCAEGTEYNEELGICDWPDNANCVVEGAGVTEQEKN